MKITSQNIVYYSLKALMTLGFIGAAIPKLTLDATSVNGFAQVHLPIWFMIFIGCAEAAGAIGLWIPRLSRYAIYGLLIILAGAVVITLVFQSALLALMPLVFAAVLGVIYWFDKKRSR